MKQIMLHGVDDWRLDDIAEPQPGARDALVRIAACGICGTDVSYVHMGMTPGHPIPLGHEMAGVIEETVRAWDAQDAARRIELQVGRDLQFIRINGTVVGGLAGLALHALRLLLQ